MKILKNLSQITVSKNIPISKAVRKISFHESGVLLILKKRKIIGYLQEGDIKRALLNACSASPFLSSWINIVPKLL